MKEYFYKIKAKFEDTEGLEEIENAKDLVVNLEPPFVLEVLQAFENLLSKISEKLVDYDSIIGDDASGRLPTLVFIKLINRIRRDEGRSAIKSLFIGGGITKEIQMMKKLKTI